MHIFIILILLISYSFSDDYTDVNQTKNNTPGQIFNDYKVDLLYGYQIFALNMFAKVKEESSIDAGNYDFHSVVMESKDIRLSIKEFSLSYNEQVNALNKPNEDDLLIVINQLIAGFGVPNYTNTLLKHTANNQLIIRKAKFSGKYTRDTYQNNFEMDKTKYSYKFLDNTGVAKVLSLLTGFDNSSTGSYQNSYGVKIWSYWQLDYEKSTLPQVIYTTSTDGDDLDFIDPNFKVKKYTLLGGKDAKIANIVMGYRWGLGMSFTELSDYADNEVKKAGVSNLDASSAVNYQLALKIGYSNTFIFEYTEFELNLLYDAEYFKEFSSETTSEEDDNGKAELVYDRSEILQTLQFNIRWSF